MFQRYGGGNMDEGWTRLMFEQFSLPFTSLMDAEIKAGGLEAKYDVIILPADSIAGDDRRAAAGGAAAGGGGGGGGGGWPGQHAARVSSGFGAEGVKALQAFVQKGGTLVTFAQAGDLPIQRFGLPVRNVVAGLPSKEFWSPGSTLRVSFDNTQSARLRHAGRRPGAVHGRRPGLRSDVHDRQPGRRDPLDLRRSRPPAERLAARRGGDCEEGGGGVGEATARARWC